ncbi:hypothetical protein NP233_g6123 [Leucocoprinus birnbaumii]|uniref:Nephrocystin 3-like N-terminal domain-containing protein n=1 Tax=Leucocoprinus birnbaumii TaxID=56174 RepID=A0AAD5YTY2_9AGAR|nr:hypothetical protein NP233_g6123 [Leucocoprinus birnbaumii]
MVLEATAAARDASTNMAYDSHLHSYLDFVNAHQLNIEPTPKNLARFVCYMSNFVKPSTAETYLSGITTRLRYTYPNVKDARHSDLVRDALAGSKRLKGVPIKRKLPLTTAHLRQIIQAHSDTSDIDDRLFVAITVIGFFGLLRLGEMTDPNDIRLINRKKTIRRDSLSITADELSFILPASKTDKFFAGNEVRLRKSTAAFCPVDAMKAYLSLRDQNFADSPWLWVTSHGYPPSRKWYMYRFRQFFGPDFGGHSLRAGGATFLARNGVAWDLIQALGLLQLRGNNENCHYRCTMPLASGTSSGSGGPLGAANQLLPRPLPKNGLDLKRLGAAFFFSHPNKRNDPKQVVPSLTYQLATHCPPYKALITSRLSDDPQLLTKAIPVQFKKLIIEPFSELQQRGLVNSEKPFVIILDGLDECEGDRPEAHLKHTFARIPICNPEELAIDKECRTGVERYLISGLSELQVKYDIDSSWPPVEKVNAMTESGDGHFIFAAVTLGFIGDEEYGSPVERLNTLIVFLDDVERDGTLNPLAKLDALYMHILAEIPDKIFPTTWRILAHFIFARKVVPSYTENFSQFLYDSAQVLCNFINVDQSTFYSALRKLHSVIADYLVDANRSGRFAVEEKRALVDITKSLFHCHEVDAAHFHTQDGPWDDRSHDHAALPGLKWTSGLDVKSLSSNIAEFGTDRSWYACMQVGPDPDLLSYVFQLDMRHLYIDLTSWCLFVNQCYKKDLLGDFCRTEPSEEFDALLLDRLKMMTNQEPAEPASFPLTWFEDSRHRFRDYVLMGYGPNSSIPKLLPITSSLEDA